MYLIHPPYSLVPPLPLFTEMDWKHYASCSPTPLLCFSLLFFPSSLCFLSHSLPEAYIVREVISWRESTAAAGLDYFLFMLRLLPVLFLCAARTSCLILEAGGLWITQPLSCTHSLTCKPPLDTLLCLLSLAQDCWIEFASALCFLSIKNTPSSVLSRLGKGASAKEVSSAFRPLLDLSKYNPSWVSQFSYDSVTRFIMRQRLLTLNCFFLT